MTTAFIVVGVCVLVQAFFSGSEMAVVSLDRMKLSKWAMTGSRRARILESFLDTPQRFLATTLTGTQLAVVTSTIVMTVAVLSDPRLSRYGELISIGLLSPILLVFGEVMPKTFFQQHADRIAPRIAVPLWVASILFSPIVFALSQITQVVTRLLKIEEPRALVTREELELLLRSPTTSAEITEGERRMITSIFDFSTTTVYDIMAPLSEVFMLPEHASFDEAVREVQEKQHTRVPIYRERVDQIIGIVRTFELLKAGAKQGTVGELALPAIYAPETQAAIDLLIRLQRERRNMAVVVDEYGGAVGIVTVEDILEEIVGEIEDEHDRLEPSLIRREGPGLWRVFGRTPVKHFNAQAQAQLPEGEEYETIAGLLLDWLKRIPLEGESIKIGNSTLTVVKATQRSIEEVRIKVGRR